MKMPVNEKGREAALLPCPLCGSRAFMDGKYWVCCNNGDCQTSTRPFETEAEAIAAWNLRAACNDAEPVTLWRARFHDDRGETWMSWGLWAEKNGANGYENRQGYDYEERQFISCAPRPSTGAGGGVKVKVRDFVWSHIPSLDVWSARLPIGGYWAWEREGVGYWTRVEEKDHERQVAGTSLADARAAAQADYDRRILTAIEPVAASPGVGESDQWQELRVLFGFDGPSDAEGHHRLEVVSPAQIVTHVRHIAEDRARLLFQVAASPSLREAQTSVPDGWKLVPVEPTKAMVAAFSGASPGFATSGYLAMLAAAPTSPAPAGGDVEAIDTLLADLRQHIITLGGDDRGHQYSDRIQGAILDRIDRALSSKQRSDKE